MRNNPIPDPQSLAIARQSGAMWIRFDCKHWALPHNVWKIFRLLNGLKQEAHIGYLRIEWRESDGGDWEIGLLGERPIGGLEIGGE